LIVQGDGKIVVAGLDGDGDDSNFANRPALARFNADGALDTTFGTNGVGFCGGATPLTDSAPPTVVGVDSAGRFVGITSTGMVRWTPQGDADTTFGPDGELDLPTVQFGFTRAIAIDAEDRVLYPSRRELFRVVDQPRPVMALGSNGSIIITGDAGSADNTVTIAQSGANVVVTRNGVTTNFPAADVHGLDILMFDGDDTITSSIDVMAALINLGDGANTLTLGDGDANITSGAGNDHITVGDGDHTITTAAGNDSITTGNGQMTIDGGDGNDSIATGSGNDSIQAGSGNDTITAGGGNDTVFAGFGADSVVGGAGDDLLVGSFDLTGSESEDLSVNGDNVIHGGDGDDLLIGGNRRDSLYGGANKDILVGRAGSDLLAGGGGKDRIAGNGGRDRIYGGAGDDQLDGGVHDDRVFGGDGNDRIFGGRGIDILHGDAGDDRFLAKDNEADQLDGGAGTNTAVAFDDIDELLNITAQP
jgi:Ca2+-binding RTX toxin-like protein